MTVLTMRDDQLSQRRQRLILTSQRKRLILGREVQKQVRRTNMGRILYYEPSPADTNTEGTLIYGPPGAGKTYIGYALASQSYFAEGRTWIILDTKLSYIGNNRPNVEYAAELMEHGLVPMGIPSENMTVAAPSFYINAATPKELDATKVTDVYKIPLRLCSPRILFELAKMNRGAAYSATFDMKFKELLQKTNKRPTKKQLFDMIKTGIIENDDYPNVIKWAYKNLIQKIREVENFTIDDTCYWSVIGEALKRASETGRPGWIVFTLAHAQNAQDDANLALVTAVLEEIKEFAQEARINGYNIKLGVMIDEMHTFVRQSDKSSTEAIHDLIFMWGRTSKVWRMFMTQKKEQLPKTFQDDIAKHEMLGTYQNLIECQSIPESGYGKMLDRLNAQSRNDVMSDEPRYLPGIKFCPPLIEVESNISDDEQWRQKVLGVSTGGRVPGRMSNEDMQDSVLRMLGRNVQHSFPSSAIGRLSMDQSGDTTPIVTDPGNIPELNDMWRTVQSNLVRNKVRVKRK